MHKWAILVVATSSEKVSLRYTDAPYFQGCTVLFDQEFFHRKTTSLCSPQTSVGRQRKHSLSLNTTFPLYLKRTSIQDVNYFAPEGLHPMLTLLFLSIANKFKTHTEEVA